MNVTLPLALALLLSAAAPQQPAGSRPGLERFTGAWDGTVTHLGESQRFSVEIAAAADGEVTLKATIPVIHVSGVTFLKTRPEIAGNELKLGPFLFALDTDGRTLRGTIPDGLAPVYRLPFVLHRAASIAAPVRPQPAAPIAGAAWTYDAGAALWAGPTFAAGAVYFGGDDGVVHAVDAKTGAKRWTFRAGGSIRTRPSVDGSELYVVADDGYVYKLAAATGAEAWRVKVAASPIVRLPFDDPKSRYDRFGADATVAAGRVYVGSHDGRVLALSPHDGRLLWEHATGDSVLGAPAHDDGRVYAGSFDGHVYALEAASGRLLWKRDTRGAVVSTPAVSGGRVVIGNRSYDVLGLDAASGEVAWRRYLWFSWVESSATTRDGVAYLGSSDGAVVSAFEAASGRPLWRTDVYGWAWGQPAATPTRVYAGTSSTPGYLGGAHRGGAVALERTSGRMVWRYEAQPVPGAPKPGTYGFPGSPAVGEGLVFFTGLDGLAYAFPQ